LYSAPKKHKFRPFQIQDAAPKGDAPDPEKPGEGNTFFSGAFLSLFMPMTTP
jgi:hypothetical protein